MAASHRSLNHHSRESSDYYFYVGADVETGDGTGTLVAMTSAPYFREEHAQSDWHLTQYIQGYLHGLQMDEVMEGVFTSPLAQEHVRAVLIQRGFQQSPAFDEMHRADDPGEEAPAVEEEEEDEDIIPVRPPAAPQEAPRGKPIWERLDEDADEEERVGVPATPIEIGLIRKDPRKVTLTCDCCGVEAVYTFKAAHRILGVCPSSGCMQKSLQKMETWAKAAQSKSWGLIQEDVLDPPKPKPPAKEAILEFQQEQRLDLTGELDDQTVAALRRAGRSGMIPIWKERLQEENSQEDSWSEPDPV